MQNKDLGSLVKATVIGVALAICVASPVRSETIYDALHINHELVAKRESGPDGYFSISKDNYGGYSYGKWQVSTERRYGRKSTFDFFLEYLKKHSNKNYQTLMVAGGQPAAFSGTPEFRVVWETLANKNSFKEAYDNFILDTQIIPVYKRLDKTEKSNLRQVTRWGSTDNAVQAAIKSTIIQHGAGGAYKMITRVMENLNPRTKDEFLKQLYLHRGNRFPMYKKRYNAEYNDLRLFLESGKSKIVLDNKIFKAFRISNLIQK